jgi:CxxC-x17-CxxC domain-containing protein
MRQTDVGQIPGSENKQMFTDRRLVCRDCQQEFVFTAGEQEFYESRGFTNIPSHCPACRAERKAQGSHRSWSRSERRGVYGERQMYAAICANCGRETQVPFQPRTDRAVYCPDCYQDRRRDQRTRW